MATKLTNVVGSARTLKAAALAAAVMAGMVGGVGAANAAITGVTGSTTWLGVNPPNAQQFNLTGPNVYAWDEQVAPAFNVGLNLFGNGTYTGFSPYFAGFLTAGAVESHMLHFDPGAAPPFAAGSVSFSGTIIGAIFDETLLSATDASHGALGTVYDTGNPFRSFGGNVLGNTSLTIAGNTMSFQFMPTPGQMNRMCEVRVFTLVPTPGSISLAGLAGIVGLRRARRGQA
jgi:hypothetical protein